MIFITVSKGTNNQVFITWFEPILFHIRIGTWALNPRYLDVESVAISYHSLKKNIEKAFALLSRWRLNIRNSSSHKYFFYKELWKNFIMKYHKAKKNCLFALHTNFKMKAGGQKGFLFVLFLFIFNCSNTALTNIFGNGGWKSYQVRSPQWYRTEHVRAGA